MIALLTILSGLFIFFVGFYYGLKAEKLGIAKDVKILGECKLIIKDEVYEVRKVEQ